MKNKGFTLVELLAVIVILAIIALIAVPTILHIIEESKIKSLEISTSEYIRAVNISLMNKGINENVSDGLYTITDDGKKIVLGDKEIDIEYEGKGLKSGQLLIENSKVVRVLKGFIDDYYARVNGDDITILKDLKENTLVDGKTFNAAIKNLVKDTDGTDATYSTVDKKVKSIEFLQDGVLPEGYTKEELEELPKVDLSSKSDESIKGYYNEETRAIYVYSDGYISFSSAEYMFYKFQSVEEIEFNLIDTSKVTTMSYMFEGCSSLTTLDLTSFDTSSVTNMYTMFFYCSSLTTLDLSNFDTSKVISVGQMFEGCSSLTTLDLSSFDTSKVSSIWAMFRNCNSLETLDLSNFDTSKVLIMQSMFYGCSSLTALDLTSFDTSKVTDMSGMFFGCSNLKEIKGIEKFNTSSVTIMNSMFSGCSSLTTLDLNSFDTNSVKYFGNMFYRCKSLKSIEFGKNFDTSQGNNMDNMFSGCSSLTALDLTSFDTSSVTNAQSMFSGCSNLTSVKVTTGKWNKNASEVSLKDNILQYVGGEA